MQENVFAAQNQFVMLTMAQVEAMINEAVSKAVSATEEKLKGMMMPEAIAPQTSPGERRTLTVKEVKALLHVDESTLWRYNKKGILPKHNGGERRVLYYYDEVMAFMDADLKGKHQKGEEA